MAADASGTWLQRMTALLAKVKCGDAEIGTSPSADALAGPFDTASYLAAMEQIAPIYDCLLGAGMGSKILKGDINGTCGFLRGHLELPGGAGATLQGIVDWGMANVDRKKLVSDPMSTVRAVIWANRASMFSAHFIKNMIDGLEGTVAARKAYDDNLKMYHGWITGKAVGGVMSLAPMKEKIFASMGLPSEAEANAQAQAFLAVMLPLTGAIVKFLEAKGANFPDKVEIARRRRRCGVSGRYVVCLRL